MSVEQYQGLLRLAVGTIFFVVMFLVLRFLSRRSKQQNGAAMSQWNGMEPLTVVDVIEETHNIKTFVLKRQGGEPFPHFRAGQFLSFQIGDDPKQVRSYSISSPQSDLQTVRISIKRLDNGIGSGWFHSLRRGSTVFAHRPNGHFTDTDRSDQPRTFIAGGIGITPILSIIQTHLENKCSFEINLFYGFRTQEDMAFHSLFVSLKERHPNFHYYPVLSHDPNWSGDKGFLSYQFILQKIGNLNQHRIFICGPDVMTEPMIEKMLSSGISERQIAIEKFASPSTFDESTILERQVTVYWQGQPLKYSGRENLLAFLEQNGAELPFACRAGVCGTCKCKVDGPVKVLTKSGLTLQEQASGLVLACVAFPEGDVEVMPPSSYE